MRFSTFSLFALSSLFIGAFAAPTAHRVRDVAIAEVEQRDTSITAVEERGLPEIVVIVNSLVTEVFSYTAAINVTISSCEGISLSITKKVSIIAGIQVQVQKIIAAISAAILKIYTLELIKLVEIDFELLISSVVKILIEIVSTFLYAAKILQCSIIELLGFTLGLFLNTYISFLLAICKVVFDFQLAIKAALTIYFGLIGKVFVDFASLIAICL